MPSLISVVNDVATWPPEFLAAAAVFVSLVIASQLCFAYALYSDSVARGRSSPETQAALAFFAPLFGPFALVYLLRLWRIPDRNPSPSKRELVAAAVPLGVLAAFLVGAFVSPPDPITQILYAVPTMLVTIPLAYLVVSKRTEGGSRPEPTA
ncbi:hypothetical protein AUR64_01730 [Haloprofundus marisrubri]|uniref:Uncharacterized protein n=1 Tax=Haloprofundus marisrubri TaxID=1514971 RepID=A0A0W1R3P2_9EURY|nr:hypothetical protein [Haloprofundus marisrubri]KTG07977.1 hypothetical protein AUR64_01730 [Haloprofundus marisrubri]